MNCVCAWCTPPARSASSPPPGSSAPALRRCASGCVAIRRKSAAAWRIALTLLAGAPTRLPPSSSASWGSRASSRASARVGSRSSSSCPSARAPSPASSASKDWCAPASASLSPNRICEPGKPPGRSFPSSVTIPRTWTTSPAIGLKPRPCACPWCNTPPGNCAPASPSPTTPFPAPPASPASSRSGSSPSSPPLPRQGAELLALLQRRSPQQLQAGSLPFGDATRAHPTRRSPHHHLAVSLPAGSSSYPAPQGYSTRKG